MIDIREFRIGYGRTPLSLPLSAHSADATCLLISGETGCGKSSCLRALVALPGFWFEGTADVQGVTDCNPGGQRNGVSYLSQDRVDAGDLTIREFLALGADTIRWRTLGAPLLNHGESWLSGGLRRIEPQLLQPLGDLDRPVHSLNHAHARYAAIIRLRLSSVRLALLDEPFEGLGASLSGLVLDLLGEALERGLALIIVDHKKLITKCGHAVIEEPAFQWTYGE